MIVISISLTIIGLVVWSIGDNYHFASDLMAGQEINAMTPKQGYNIVSFDDSQPVGAKLKLLEHAETSETALQLKEAYAATKATILVFDSSLDDNNKLVGDTRAAAAKIAQEKASATANPSTQGTQTTTSNMSAVANTSATTSSHGNESITVTEKLNTTANGNQATTNSSKKSVNLDENVGITSK